MPSLAASAASSAPSRGEAAPVPLATGPAGAGPERAAIWPARSRAARSVARPATTVPVEPYAPVSCWTRSRVGLPELNLLRARAQGMRGQLAMDR